MKEYDEQDVLNSTYLNGMFTERERITALIDIYCDGHHSALDNCSCSILIALSKGVNSERV